MAIDEITALPKSGRVSVRVDPGIAKKLNQQATDCGFETPAQFIRAILKQVSEIEGPFDVRNITLKS